MVEYWWVFLAAILLLVFLVWAWFPVRAGIARMRFAEARRNFHHQRERLEAKFVQLGMVSTRPEASRWIDCDFEDEVAYARNRTTGELSAFVAVTLEMEDLPDRSTVAGDAVSNLRAATAVFRFDGRHWETDGRAIFNLTPTEAIRHYQRDLELLAQEVPGRP
jgi:hypothetical protein